jgi:Tfp pilus assembly protein PilO
MRARVHKFFAYVRHRPLVTGCFVLSVLLGTASYFLWEQRAVIARQHEEARRNGEFMLQALKNRTKIESDLAALREAMAQIDGNLLEEQSMEVNLGYFYRFEKMTRVRLARLNQLATPAPVAGAKFKAVPFSMQVTGTYRNNMSFLRALETGPRIVRIRNCSFERPSETSTELVMDLIVEVLAKS